MNDRKKKEVATKLRNDPDFYKKIGAKGGRARVPKGFAANPKLAALQGKKRKKT